MPWPTSSAGAGVVNVQDIVYVTDCDLVATKTRAVGQEVGRSARLIAAGRPYLAWPGAGASDRASITDRVGQHRGFARHRRNGDLQATSSLHRTHFFQNIVSLGVGYLTVTAATDGPLDRAWLDGSLPNRRRGVRHIR